MSGKLGSQFCSFLFCAKMSMQHPQHHIMIPYIYELPIPIYSYSFFCFHFQKYNLNSLKKKSDIQSLSDES